MPMVVSKRKTGRGLLGLSLVVFLSCHDKNDSNHATDAQTKSVKDSVVNLANEISNDLSKNGPEAWLKYFSQTPNFFMASEGQCVFPSNDSATRFIREILVKNISKINLNWRNIHVDSLSPAMAELSANFHEDLTDKTNEINSVDGYFTGLAEETNAGWKLRNLHWSTIKK
jgi:hypothetical protein